MIYLNEIDHNACEWMRNLMTAGHIPEGVIDERSITEVRAADLVGYRQCHFFAGIGGWSHALALAGWPDAWPIWSASCPCQPFSAAGKQRGEEDERHLWPVLSALVRECRPHVLVGEQVGGAAGYAWLDGVRADLESEGYAFGAADLPAAGVGAPHIRQRLYWVAISECGGFVGAGADQREHVATRRSERDAAVNERESGEGRGCKGGAPVWLGDTPSGGQRTHGGACGDAGHADQPGEGVGVDLSTVHGHRPEPERGSPGQGEDEGRSQEPGGRCPHGRSVGVFHPDTERREADACDHAGHPAEPVGTGASSDLWSDYRLIPCRDGKTRRVSLEPGDEPLAHGIPRDMGRTRALLEAMGISPKEARRMLRRPRSLLAMAGRSRTIRLRGYGNAIVPHLAAVWIRAVMDYLAARNDTH